MFKIMEPHYRWFFKPIVRFLKRGTLNELRLLCVKYKITVYFSKTTHNLHCVQYIDI